MNLSREDKVERHRLLAVARRRKRQEAKAVTMPARAAAPIIKSDRLRVGKMTLEQAQDVKGCRFPYGHLPDMTFCGNIPASPWCDEHRAVVCKTVGG